MAAPQSNWNVAMKWATSPLPAPHASHPLLLYSVAALPSTWPTCLSWQHLKELTTSRDYSVVCTASGLQLVFVVSTPSSSSLSSSSLARLWSSALSHHRSVGFFAASWVDFQKSRLSGLILTSFFGSKMDCSSNWDSNWDFVPLSSRPVSSVSDTCGHCLQ